MFIEHRRVIKWDHVTYSNHLNSSVNVSDGGRTLRHRHNYVFAKDITEMSWSSSVRLSACLRYGAYSAEEVYTTVDVDMLMQYGRERGVRILLELDMPAHAGEVGPALKTLNLLILPYIYILEAATYCMFKTVLTWGREMYIHINMKSEEGIHT